MSVRLISYAEDGNVEGLRECLSHIDVDFSNKKGDTALHITCRKGYKNCVRLLVASGAALDKKNGAGQTPLHIAVLCRHNSIAILLLQSGANVNARDDAGDSPIHIASKEGYVEIVQTLCDYGCFLDQPNDLELFPLHLAARNGHIEVVRILCLSGCNIEQTNGYGIKAEIMAFKYCHQDIGYLLNKLRISYLCDAYINQFAADERGIPKLSVKFLGCSGVGKTTLVQSLKAGYFTGLFSRSKSQSSGSTASKLSLPSTPNENQIEMDVTFRQNTANDFPNYQYTRGIELHQATFASGDFSLWDFSGLDTFYTVYDFFIGDVCSVYVLVFNLCDPPDVQYYQCSFWLTFLQARLHSSDLMNRAYPHILLVATHADAARIHRDLQGNFVSASVQEMKSRLAEEFSDFVFDAKVIICDAHLPNSLGIRELKYAISEKKLIASQHLLFKATGFLIGLMQYLQTLKKEYEMFPVITWSEFVDKVHKHVNPLAGSDHIMKTVQLLIVMGELRKNLLTSKFLGLESRVKELELYVGLPHLPYRLDVSPTSTVDIFQDVISQGVILYLKSNAEDLIILNMNWLCSELIGGLLSLEAIARARLTGCYTEDDFQGCFPYGPADKILVLLTALQICVQCENDGEIEYEFPCYNLVEKLDGLWEAADERYSPQSSCYGGVRLKAPCRLLQIIFPRLQVKLRSATNLSQDPEIDLYQWFRGSKLCSGDMESLITLEDDGQVIDIKVRGTDESRLLCFYFLEDILSIIQQMMLTTLPGIVCERHILSSKELRLHADSPYCWPPEDLLTAILSPLNLNAILENPKLGHDENVLQLIGFGSEELSQYLALAGELSIESLPVFCQRALARLLDPIDPLGRDWCLLAVKLGLSQKIAVIDNTPHFSKTLVLLELWKKSADSTIGNLIQKLVNIGREDAAIIVMRSAPPYKVLTSNYEPLKLKTIDY